MTAVNVIARRNRLVVATDTAFIGGDGHIQGFAPKALALPHWPGIIAMRGPIYVFARLAAEVGLRFPDVDSFAEAAPEFLAEFVDEHGHMLGCHGEAAAIHVTAAGFSRAHNACRAFMIAAGDTDGLPAAGPMGDDAHEIPSGRVVDLPTDALCMTPLPPPEEMRACGIDPDMDLSRMDLAGERRLLVRVLEAQRRNRFELIPGEEPIHTVGGRPVFLTLFRDGTILTSAGPTWPDEIGQKISVSCHQAPHQSSSEPSSPPSSS